MRNPVDVLVIGGGPAGLAAAIAASQKGFRVTVADGAAPPIDKTCGEGMMPETQTALNALGVTIAPHEGFRFRGIRFISRSTGTPACAAGPSSNIYDSAGFSAPSRDFREMNLACAPDPSPHISSGTGIPACAPDLPPPVQITSDFPHGSGIGLRRPLLHEKLIVRAEQCGVQLFWKSPVTAINAHGAMVNARFMPAHWIIGADGQGSRVRKWSGLHAARSPVQRYANRRHYRVTPWSDFMEVYWSGRVQAYVTPIAAQEICVVLMAENPEDVSFDRALGNLPQLREHLRGAELASRERGAVTISKSLKNIQRHNVALIGDASGSVDAITGEGLRLGFQQAFALADAMAAGNLASYQRRHRALERRPMTMARLMLLLGRHPSFRTRVFHSFSAQPELFSKLLAFHTGEATPAQFLSAGAALGWRLLAA